MKRRKMGIKLRLICLVTPILLIMIIAFFALAGSVVYKLSKEKLKEEAQVYAGEINEWTDGIFRELKVYQETIESGVLKNDQEILNYLETTLDKNDAYPVGLYMGDDSGVYLDGSGWVPGDDWVLEERDWYIQGKENQQFAFGEPYYDSMTEQVCVSASVRVDYKKAVRVLATDVYLDYVSKCIADISAKSDVNAFLVTRGTKTIIAHENGEMVDVKLDEGNINSLYSNISNAIDDNITGFTTIKGDEGKYYICLNHIDNSDWYLVTYVTKKEVLGELYRMENLMLLIAIATGIILNFIIIRMMNGIVKPVSHMTEVIDKIAKGDFSQNLDSRGKDEIARMSNNMQSFINQMRETITEITDIAGWLEKQSVENEELSDSLKESSHNQAEEMNNLESMAEQLSVAVDDASNQIAGLVELVAKTNSEGEAAENMMRESVVMSRNGKGDMEQIIVGMDNISNSIFTLSKHIDSVGNAISKIGNMVNIIIEIAEETNLLSLNASIEAARAGDAGRGFAVVAEQIGKLAVNSSEATDEISRLTMEIQTTVEDAVEYMSSSVEEVNANVQIVSMASATFENLYGMVDETSNRVQTMIELVNQVKVVSEEMKNIFSGQVDTTEQIVHLAEELNIHTENVSKDSSTVAYNAGQLQNESAQLMEKVSKFIVK